MRWQPPQRSFNWTPVSFPGFAGCTLRGSPAWAAVGPWQASQRTPGSSGTMDTSAARRSGPVEWQAKQRSMPAAGQPVALPRAIPALPAIKISIGVQAAHKSDGLRACAECPIARLRRFRARPRPPTAPRTAPDGTCGTPPLRRSRTRWRQRIPMPPPAARAAGSFHGKVLDERQLHV